jgi:hypothetical protein
MAVKKIPMFGPAIMQPVVTTLPQGKAASIGRTLTRFAYLEWRMAKTIYTLLGISIKQGRAAVRLPQLRATLGIAQDLLTFLRVRVNFDFKRLGKLLDEAERARNVLAHSLFVRDGKNIYVQVVRGSWDFGQHVESASRTLNPEMKVVDRAFLSVQRQHVEVAIKAADLLGRVIAAILTELNERRGNTPALDRRRPKT